MSDLEYYMGCLNPNLGQVESDERKKVIKEVCKCMRIEYYKAGEVIYQNGNALLKPSNYIPNNINQYE